MCVCVCVCVCVFKFSETTRPTYALSHHHGIGDLRLFKRLKVICCSSLYSQFPGAGAFTRCLTKTLAPQDGAFTRALKFEKLKAPLFPGRGGGGGGRGYK